MVWSFGSIFVGQDRVGAGEGVEAIGNVQSVKSVMNEGR
jgi:hypothetical protein